MAAASHATRGSFSSATGGGGGGAGDSNPVQEAYVKSLELQLGKVRDELGTQYKTTSQNAQRLLELNEVLRTHDQGAKTLESDLRSTMTERDRLQRQVADQADALREKNATVELLQDELNTLSLELNQVEKRNDELGRDNAQLLQRWLDAKNEEAQRMNDANIYLQEVERRRTEAPAHAAMPPSPTPAPAPAPAQVAAAAAVTSPPSAAAEQPASSNGST